MTALALPLPFPFRPPMGGGLVGGGVAPPITLEQVLYYLQNNIRPNAGQLFPVPPPLFFPGVGAGLALAFILEGLFTSPVANGELPEPSVPTLDPGLQPTEERETAPPVPRPGEWEYRNIDQYVYTRYQERVSLEDPPLYQPTLTVTELSPKSPYFRAYSVDYKFLMETSEIIYGPDVPDNLRIIDLYKLEEYNTSEGTKINDNLQPPRQALTGTTPFFNGLPAPSRFVQREWFEISKVTYKPADLFPRPGQGSGPINPQPPSTPAPETNPATKPPIERAEAPKPSVPSIQPKPLPDAPVVPGPSPTPVGPSEAPTPAAPPTPIPVPPKVPVPADPQETAPDGAVVPKPPAKVTATPIKNHFPISGGEPVTTGGVRPSLQAIADEVGRIEQKTAKTMKSMGGADLTDLLFLLQLLSDLLEADIPGTEYQLQGVCETVEEGQDQPIAKFPVSPAKNFGAIINRLDVIDNMLQQHLAWKTPTCGNARPKKEGTWISTNWRSDADSPNSNRPLRKQFRYRSRSTRSTDELQAYWGDFTWESGSSIVAHKGAWWGTPQVWASSPEEGKRVIRFAGGEAGLDPDQVGEWVVSSSNSPRYGMSRTMRLDQTPGERWVTRREGPSGFPEL